MRFGTLGKTKHTIHNREFWTEFFMLYRSLPELWNVGNPLYKDRAAKIDAYDHMVAKLNELEPHAIREDVLRRINIFRTNYRREQARIDASKKLGKKYQTTLWYFDLLSFLRLEKKREPRSARTEKQIIPKKTSNSSYAAQRKARGEAAMEFDESIKFQYVVDDELEEYEQEEEECREEKSPFQNEFRNYSMLKQESNSGDFDCITQESDFESDAFEELLVRQKTHGHEHILSDNLSIDSSLLDTKPPANIHLREDTMEPPANKKKAMSKGLDTQISESSEILARSWALQYEEMSNDQRIFARRAIADILFQGCIGNLGLSEEYEPRRFNGQEDLPQDCVLEEYEDG